MAVTTPVVPPVVVFCGTLVGLELPGIRGTGHVGTAGLPGRATPGAGIAEGQNGCHKKRGKEFGHKGYREVSLSDIKR